MKPGLIKATDAKARERYTYTPDGKVDTWTSHAADVLANKAWSGDCDDLASTVLDLLGQDGVPLDKRFRLIVSSTNNGIVDHMIAAVIDDAGDYWVVGDTILGPCYPAADMEFQAIMYNRLDENHGGGVATWREGKPWE